MLHQSVFGRLAGYEDVNDAERLRHDPAMRWIVGGKATKGCGASPSQMGRFETNWLARSENLAALTDLSGRWIDQVAPHRSRERIVLDMDSSVSPMSYTIASPLPLWIVSESGAFYHVATGGSMDQWPFRSQTTLGWVRISDVDPQAIRNCT